MPLRILFIGDVVGRPGRAVLARAVPALVEAREIHLVVANAENAAGGSGLNGEAFEQIVGAGVDVLTMGDHIYKKKEIFPLFEKSDRICKPANFPPEAPGQEFVVVAARDGTPVGVFSLLGRIFMKPVDCPFRAADRVLERLAGRAKCVVVDMHAEATSDKQLMARHLDGRVSAVLGTHTHVPTADEQILPGGTAYLTDVGMTGPYDSILGRRIDRVLPTTLDFVPSHFEVARGDPRLGGAIVEIDPESGRALCIERLMLRESEVGALAGEAQASAPG